MEKVSSYNPQWLLEDKQRVLNMERWYVLDGRHLPSHPQHGIYTGLADKSQELELDSLESIE